MYLVENIHKSLIQIIKIIFELQKTYCEITSHTHTHIHKDDLKFES